MRKWTILGMLQFCALSILTGQEVERSVMASAGKQDIATRMTLDWTLGESFIESNVSNSFLYTEGFHQPQLLEGIVKEDILAQDLRLEIYPNPVDDLLSISSSSIKDFKLLITIHDMSGKNLMEAHTIKSTGKVELDMSSLVSGMYIVSIRNEEGSFIKSYKITKSN